MSLVSLAKSIAKESYAGKSALLWVMNHVDMKKLMDRVSQAELCPDIDTKCVLLEYNYTTWESVKAGLPDTSERLPGTDLLVHAALSDPDFWRLAYEYILGNDPRAHIYSRRKIDNDTGKPNPHRMQLVVAFDKLVSEPLDESTIGSHY